MTAYYNENDPKAAEWLRQLILEDCIAPGEVDERSIADVAPADLSGYGQHHFFAGIGGWSYALRLAGWPDDKPVWTGSCPCQPFSIAGNQQGIDDERHLWPIWRWLVDQRRPAIIFGEQVASKAGRHWLVGVRADLETLGYGVGAADLCAAGIGAPHIRQRLWWVADAGVERRQQDDTNSSGYEEKDGRKPDGDHVIAGNGSGSGLADPQHDGSYSTERTTPEPDSDRQDGGIHRRSADGGMGHTDEPGLPISEGDPRSLGENSSGTEREAAEPSGYWSESIFISCADGKARRIEPGIEPLVNGLPGRVGLLRGYGNAIVPELAAEFVMACDQTGHGQSE